MEVVLILLIVGWFIYRYLYFKSDKFLEIKNSIKDYTKNCNELNDHIEELKSAYVDLAKIDYGQADYVENSQYNFKRPGIKNIQNSSSVYNCSSTVCSGARQQPFKYICKYFNIKTDESTLIKFEEVLNDFSAAEQGKLLLKNERDNILSGVSNKIPYLIRILSKKKLIRELGFKDIDLSQIYFPKFSFRYTSAGGNSSNGCDIILNIDNLDRFVNYLSSLVKFRKSIAGQRALMTSSLREEIKNRDKYTCRHCGVSIYKEPNLLLEIDHIIPLSKNGLSTKENLQTLCWKCNRTKGSKITLEAS